MLYWAEIHLIKHRASVNTPGFDDPKTCSSPNCRICNIDNKVRDSIYKEKASCRAHAFTPMFVEMLSWLD